MFRLFIRNVLEIVPKSSAGFDIGFEMSFVAPLLGTCWKVLNNNGCVRRFHYLIKNNNQPR